ncbi:MAG: type III pantothenate kinase [Bacteroidales bacterium]|jgi:type III pantothenate kinase|nr:type III pantothenate kinase [Bacteroidales bacterium]
MEYLVLDFGNTNKKLAVFKDRQLIDLHQFPEISLPGIRKFVGRYPAIQHSILSSVIRHPASVVGFLKSHYQLLELDEKTPLPLKNQYRSQNTLGKDRLACAVAGSRIFPGNDVLVINAGTCITYDFVNMQGKYLGGGISPGLQMRFQALHTFTDKLPLVSLQDKETLIGRNTEESILTGVLTGVTTEIEGIVGRYTDKYPGLTVVLSGGDQKYINKRLKISIFAFPNIVIYGLQQILEFNVNKIL